MKRKLYDLRELIKKDQATKYISCNYCLDIISIEKSVGSIYRPGTLICQACADIETEARQQEEPDYYNEQAI